MNQNDEKITDEFIEKYSGLLEKLGSERKDNI